MSANLPIHLSDDQAQGLKKGEPIAQFEIGSTQNFVYLILDWSSLTASIVDPQVDLSEPLTALEKHGFKLRSILLTHTHFDHTAGVQPLLDKFPNLEIFLGKSDLHRLPKEVQNLRTLHLLKDGESVRVGSEVILKTLHTPGHSAGEFSYFLAASAISKFPYLFTGDTIFIGDCGRTDFEDGSNEQMFASIQKIKTLPPETVFLVGHHYAKACATTLAEELKNSPPFRCPSVEALAALP